MTTTLSAPPNCSATPLKHVDLEKLVKSKLQPMPASAQRILELIRDVDVSTNAIAEAIGYDHVLTSRILRLANSPMYALRREVTKIGAAVSAVGIRSIYDIVMFGIAADNFSKDMWSTKTGVSVWEHSVAVAIASRTLALVLRLQGGQEAFTCGLMHDIGKTLLYQHDPINYMQIDNEPDEEGVIRLEKVLFGFDHTQVGMYVAHQWGIPSEVCNAILHHHNPKAAKTGVAVTHIINVADELVTLKGYGLHPGNEDELPRSESVEILRLTDDQMEDAWIRTEMGLEDLLNIG